MDCLPFPDVHGWIQGLRHVSQWHSPYLNTDVANMLQLFVTNSQTGNLSTISFYIRDSSQGMRYWESKPIELSHPTSMKLLHDFDFFILLNNFIEDILSFCSNKNDFTMDPSKLNPDYSGFKDIFNLCFFTISIIFLAKWYHNKGHRLRPSFNIWEYQVQSSSSQLTKTSKKLMQILGHNLEVEWMRSISVAYAYWNQSSTSFPPFKTLPYSLSCSISTNEFWKVHLFCPITAMTRDNFGNDKFLPSLNKYQIEGVFQLHYKVVVKKDCIDVVVNVDNIRIDVLPLIQNEEFKTLENEEKHFPSRVLLNLTPVHERSVTSISIRQSSHNPTTQLELQKNVETLFQSSQPFIGLKLEVGEAMLTNLKPWKFEVSAGRYEAILDWVLHDVECGRKEVYSSELPKKSGIKPTAWFRGRYSSVNRPFVKQGGVIFAGDEYGQPIHWRINKNVIQDITKWKLKGKIWLTYWPNKIKTSYYETRSTEFEKILDLTIP